MKKLTKLIPFFAVFIFISYNLVWVYTKNLIENEITSSNLNVDYLLLDSLDRPQINSKYKKNPLLYFLKNKREIISNLFYLNPELIAKKPVDYKIILSNKDQDFLDSTISIATKYAMFPKSLKKWRKSNLIYDGNNYRVKFKLHGSSISPYLQDKLSIRVKSSKLINGMKEFTLISCLEMDYKNIFLNSLGRDYNLITEDPGTISSLLIGNVISDFFVFEKLDQSYVKDEFNRDLIRIFKKNKTPYNHASEFDEVYYNLENWDSSSNELEIMSLNKYSDLLKSNYNLTKIEKEYIGRFLALIYLFGSSHQINGDNEVWLGLKDEFVPLYRNENEIKSYIPINKKKFDNHIFTTDKPESSSLNKYKRFLIDDDVRNFRNTTFNHIIKNKKHILKKFDSIYSLYEETHKRYNSKYLTIKLQHDIYKNIIRKNIEIISKYLKINTIYSIHQKDTFKIVTDSYVPLKLLIGENEFKINPRKYYLDIDKNINHNIKEERIFINSDFRDYRIINSITGDTIKKKITKFE